MKLDFAGNESTEQVLLNYIIVTVTTEPTDIIVTVTTELLLQNKCC